MHWSKLMRTVRHSLTVLLSLLLLLSISDRTHGEERVSAILALEPIGYWPLQNQVDGKSPDKSPSQNSAIIHGLEWKDQMPIFTGFNQWIEIPAHSVYEVREISVGAWLYSSEEYDRIGPQLIGNAFRNSKLRLKNLDDEIELRPWNAPLDGVSIFLPKQSVSVKLANTKNLFELRKKPQLLDKNRWQHILLTIDELGQATLHVNGKKVAQKKAHPYQPSVMPWILGIQADNAPVNQWWNKGIRGSIQDVVLFDRALEEAEITTLSSVSPEGVPVLPQRNESTVTTKGNHHLSTEEAAKLLISGSEQEVTVAARALAGFGKEAVQYLTQLQSRLEADLNARGVYQLRSNDSFRNALIWALEEVGGDDASSRELLAKAYAKPFFEHVDLQAEGMGPIRNAYKSGDYLAALELHRALPNQETITAEVIDQLPNPGMLNMKGDRIYSPIAKWNGNTYLAGLEWVSPEEITSLPNAAEWGEKDKEWFARTVITTIDPDGKHTRHTLEGPDFIYSAYDAKMWGWSIVADRDGYLHLMGGMHNIVMPERFIPESLESLGASRDFEADIFPNLMYWVSEKPGDPSTFKFVGHRNNPRTIPVFQGLNYMPFVRDRLGNIYTFGRVYVQGVQSYGLYRYDPDNKQWKALGGYAPDMKKADPVWADHMAMTGDVGSIRSLRLDHQDPRSKVLFWDKPTSFYNFCRGMLRFDKNNRMHIAVPLNSVNGHGEMQSVILYTYSDDLGETFHRANGDIIESFPMGARPGSFQADVVSKGGSCVVFFDAQGIPGIYVPGRGDKYYWHTGKGEWVKDKAVIGGLSNVFIDNKGVISHRSEQGGVLSRSSGHGQEAVRHEVADIFQEGDRAYTINLDWQSLYDEGNWLSVLARYNDREFKMPLIQYKISTKAEPIGTPEQEK